MAISEKVSREIWANQMEYFLSCLGYAVGIGNVWRFPYLCYKNGGGAFLIPYFLTLILCGIPLVYLETSLGQFASVGCISLFNITPILKGAGYAVIVLNSIALTYFSVIMGYSLLFLLKSFQSPLPWKTCDNIWNTPDCFQFTGNASFVGTSNNSFTTPEEEYFYRGMLRMTPSFGGPIVWPVFFSNVCCWVIAFLCICKGVKSVGKIVYFTVLFPYVVLTVLLIRGVTLPGAMEGLKFYLYPDWKELGNPKVWADGAIQIFYSLGPGWGGLVSMASFNKFHYNNMPSSIFVPLINSGTSIYAGFVVFSVLGFAAHRSGVEVGAVATAGPGLAFVTYPAALNMMTWPNLWAIIFFFMLMLLAIDTLFVTIEAVVTGLLDEWPHLKRKKSLVTLLTCCILCSFSTFCATEGGMHVLEVLDANVAAACVPLVCLLELVSAMYVYGSKQLSKDIEFMTGKPLHRFWIIVWKYVNPALLIVIMLYTLWASRNTSAFGWVVMLSSIIFVPLQMVNVLNNAKGTMTARIKECSKPTKDWGPADEEHKQAWLQLQDCELKLINLKP